jgi:hypothetical protein
VWVGTSQDHSYEALKGTSDWRAVFNEDFVDHSQSQFPARAFWLPGLRHQNAVVDYAVFVRAPIFEHNASHHFAM